MLASQISHDRLLATQGQLQCVLQSIRPEIPASAITVLADSEDMLSAQVYGVEQGLQRSSQALVDEVSRAFSHGHFSYDCEEIAALIQAFKIIAPKAGVAIEPGALSLVELPNGVLVLLIGGHMVAASDDPLHLFADALGRLKSQEPSRA
jgi:hypothetical protein